MNNGFLCPTGFGTVYVHTRAAELSYVHTRDPRSKFMDYLDGHFFDLSYGMSAVSIEGGAEDDEGEDESQEVDELERIAYVNGTRKPFAYIFVSRPSPPPSAHAHAYTHNPWLSYTHFIRHTTHFLHSRTFRRLAATCYTMSVLL